MLSERLFRPIVPGIYAFTGNRAIEANVNRPDFDNRELVLGGLTTDRLPNPE